MSSLTEQWKQAFLDEARHRAESLVARHKLQIEDALGEVGLKVEEFVSTFEVGLDDLPGGLAVRVSGEDTDTALLRVLLQARAENELQRFVVYATGTCRYCDRLTALKPPVVLPLHRVKELDDPAVLFGEALTRGEPDHDCAIRRLGEDESEPPGQYM